MADTRPKVFTREWFSMAMSTMTRQERTWLERAVAGILILLILGIGISRYSVLPTSKNCQLLDFSFEGTPQVEWCYAGTELPELVDFAIDGSQSVRLGKPVEPTSGFSMTSQVYHEMVIPEDYARPVLSFWYRICTNESIHYADFVSYLITSTVDIARPEPITAEVIKRDGYRCCEDQDTAPLAGYDLQWRTASYDLTHLKGQTVTLVFETNNLDPDTSLGIWTYVDDVQVVDAGSPLTPTGCPIHLPIVMWDYSVCDWLYEDRICDCLPGTGGLAAQRLRAPAPTPRPTRPPTKVPTPTPTRLR